MKLGDGHISLILAVPPRSWTVSYQKIILLQVRKTDNYTCSDFRLIELLTLLLEHSMTNTNEGMDRGEDRRVISELKE